MTAMCLLVFVNNTTGKEKFMDYKIFLDMDGVLSDFVRACEMLFNRNLYHSAMWEKSTVYDRIGVPEDIFWRFIEMNSKEFWLNMPEYNIAKTLFYTCTDYVGKENVFICSTPCADPNSAGYKAAWINKRFGILPENYFLCKQKHLIARDNHILIDDQDSVIEKWDVAGGIPIMVPRPWNSLYDLWYNDLEYVRKKLRKIMYP